MLNFSLAYGLLALTGGLIGFLKAGSMASLVAGTISGCAIIVSTLAYIRGRLAGYYALLAISLLVGGWFIKGYLATGKLFPAGLMALVSVLNIGLLAFFKKPSQHQPIL
ncbi:MAG: TMEM14 family protein [Vampirovibrionales bacterium]